MSVQPFNPNDRRYTDRHQWVMPGDDGAYVIGLSWWAHQCLVGPMHMELPTVGEHLDEGEMYGIIECLLGAIRDLYAPVACRVVAVNEELVGDPELIAVYDDPYGDGWLIKVAPDDPAALDRLLTAEQYGERTPYAREWGFGGIE